MHGDHNDFPDDGISVVVMMITTIMSLLMIPRIVQTMMTIMVDAASMANCEDPCSTTSVASI